MQARLNLLQKIFKARNKSEVDSLVQFIGNNPKKFDDLVNIFLAEPYQISQRASRVLTFCAERHPKLVKPYLKKLISNLDKNPIHNAAKRNTIRLLQFVDIPKKLQGRAAAICFQYLDNTGEPIAVRVFSMTVLANIASDKPELKNELLLLLEKHLPYGSAGFVSRAGKIIKKLKPLNLV
ncbi:MAG: hypothetical protein KF725_05860 [Cyclobacteriaceae bacterium]|nr:hypothetical protein [Cyclobacteriaceae bacterium]UYN85219.1 MAG: hypothetical protein KIT51_09950 [Cyclobacteriaceae bacterium]